MTKSTERRVPRITDLPARILQWRDIYAHFLEALNVKQLGEAPAQQALVQRALGYSITAEKLLRPHHR